MNFRGELLKDGQLVEAGISGSFHKPIDRGGIRSQSGILLAPHHLPIAVGDVCELALDDGRHAEIRVVRKRAHSPGVHELHFQVNGMR